MVAFSSDCALLMFPFPSNGKRSRSACSAPANQSGKFALGSSSEEGDDKSTPLTSGQAARLGETDACELKTRTVEPFVAS